MLSENSSREITERSPSLKHTHLVTETKHKKDVDFKQADQIG